MIGPQDFRDRYVSAVSIKYAAGSVHGTVHLSVRDAHGDIRRFQIDGVTDFSINEDFQSLAIAQCTVLIDSAGVYLCLDPYHEGARSDRDNYYFQGSSIRLD
jgi:hypothetical protein